MSKTWYFVYDGMDQNKIESAKIKIYNAQRATLQGYSLGNKSISNNNSMVTVSTLIKDPKAVTIGNAFLVDDADLYKIAKLENKHNQKEEKHINISIKSLKISPVAVTYFPKLESFSGQDDMMPSFFSGKNFTMNKFRNETKFMKWEKNNSQNNGYVMTFEEFHDKYINNENKLNED